MAQGPRVGAAGVVSSSVDEQATPTDASADSPSDWYKQMVSPGLARRLLELARDEDCGPDFVDPTSALMIEDADRGEAWVVAREAGVVCGLNVVGDVLDVLAPTSLFRDLAADGDRVQPGQRLGALLGPRREIMIAERTLLNLIGRLSGVASETARYVAAMGDTRVRVVDTRKTTPGLRQFEKYAVRCGGGFSHRMGLYDAVLIKDNHIAGLTPSEAARKVAQVAQTARERYEDLAFVEVEVDTLEQLEAMLGLDAGVLDIILLDNMPVDQLARAVEMRHAADAAVLLEASGGIELAKMGEVARTGVDRIAVGAITHHAVWLDVGLDAVAGGAQPEAASSRSGEVSPS